MRVRIPPSFRTTFPAPTFRAFPAAPGLGRFPIWLCPQFGLLSESSVCSEQPWRFELTQAVRSTKRKRHIGHLGQLVVCECLYVFFACVRRTLVSIQINNAIPKSTPTTSYSQTPEAPPYAPGKRSKPGKPPRISSGVGRKIGAKLWISTPCPSKPSSSQACHSIRKCLR